MRLADLPFLLSLPTGRLEKGGLNFLKLSLACREVLFWSKKELFSIWYL